MSMYKKIPGHEGGKADFFNQGLEDSFFVQLLTTKLNGGSLSFISLGRFFAYNL